MHNGDFRVNESILPQGQNDEIWITSLRLALIDAGSRCRRGSGR